eukprot:gnl/TRDRNA2_/TRDRNA2_198963_c0_seq1.p1 gnl/TRDRNA2_/TRDRNA2_198963_c0~~gnl/TRDRNA2_/TRDRNA2_198963_c0_seq1.p1  ORF type:complete len:213 (-),score=24.75 gnl/TRDRNA2_/TRDRNA2_198963_c0_seq1:199-816(-)
MDVLNTSRGLRPVQNMCCSNAVHGYNGEPGALDCPICMLVLCEPVSCEGPGGHLFCRNCLLKVKLAGNGSALRCPICRTVSTVDIENVAEVLDIIDQLRALDPCHDERRAAAQRERSLMRKHWPLLWETPMHAAVSFSVCSLLAAGCCPRRGNSGRRLMLEYLKCLLGWCSVPLLYALFTAAEESRVRLYAENGLGIPPERMPSF